MPRINNYFKDVVYAHVKEQPSGYVARCVEADMMKDYDALDDPEVTIPEIPEIPEETGRMINPYACKKCGAIMIAGKCKSC